VLPEGLESAAVPAESAAAGKEIKNVKP